MARDTDRLLETLARGNARRLQYDQMEAQREAQDQATGMRLQQDAANRIDQGVQFAQGQANHEQARGDALAQDADQASARRLAAAQALQLKMQEMAAENGRQAEDRLDKGLQYQRGLQQDKDANTRAREQNRSQERIASGRDESHKAIAEMRAKQDQNRIAASEKRANMLASKDDAFRALGPLAQVLKESAMAEAMGQDPSVAADYRSDFNAIVKKLVNSGVPQAEIQAAVEQAKAKAEQKPQQAPTASTGGGKTYQMMSGGE